VKNKKKLNKLFIFIENFIISYWKNKNYFHFKQEEEENNDRSKKSKNNEMDEEKRRNENGEK